ncbi:unnamed protein product, partial [Darwinula stevensoni]
MPRESKRYRVSTDTITVLGTSDSPCSKETDFGTTLNVSDSGPAAATRTTEFSDSPQCLETCLYRHVLETANATCWPYWMPTLEREYARPCGTEAEYKRIWLASGKLLELDIDPEYLAYAPKSLSNGMEDFVKKNCTHCQRACRRIQFVSSARTSPIDVEDGAVLGIVLGPVFEYHFEAWGYELPQLVSDIGGFDVVEGVGRGIKGSFSSRGDTVSDAERLPAHPRPGRGSP